MSLSIPVYTNHEGPQCKYFSTRLLVFFVFITVSVIAKYEVNSRTRLSVYEGNKSETDVLEEVCLASLQ
jgi:hypothetical protein